MLGGALPFPALCSKRFVGLKREVVALRRFEAVSVADADGGSLVAGLRLGFFGDLVWDWAANVVVGDVKAEKEAEVFVKVKEAEERFGKVMIQVGCIEPVMVLRVHKEKDYIDLRERRVYEEDIQACEERYNKSKLVHSIMRQIAEILNIDLEELYVYIGGHAFENPTCYSCNLLLELAFHTHTSGDYDQLGDDLIGHSCDTRGRYRGRVVALDQMDRSKQLNEATSCLA
ncbi:hypothetical protein V8G54_023699 [Vigna mungo]|uniref:Uncharacterized protein n=1 Tax=Vigna mungo TaxID=3915 RepID=A0AAQ3N5X0_VIGMU